MFEQTFPVATLIPAKANIAKAFVSLINLIASDNLPIFRFFDKASCLNRKFYTG
jgi:hypothetical protein